MLINNKLKTFALGCKIGATARNASEAYMQYGERVPQSASRFGAKSKFQKQTLFGLETCGA